MNCFNAIVCFHVAAFLCKQHGGVVSNEDLWRKLWAVNAFKITTARILKTRTKRQKRDLRSVYVLITQTLS